MRAGAGERRAHGPPREVLREHVVQVRVGHRRRERVVELVALGGVPAAEVHVREREPRDRPSAEVAEIEAGLRLEAGREHGAPVGGLRGRTGPEHDVEGSLGDGRPGLSGHEAPFERSAAADQVAAPRAYSGRGGEGKSRRTTLRAWGWRSWRHGWWRSTRSTRSWSPAGRASARPPPSSPSWCAGRGLEVEVVGGERPSVIATRRGLRRRPLAAPERAPRHGRRRRHGGRRTSRASRTAGCTAAAPTT